MTKTGQSSPVSVVTSVGYDEDLDFAAGRDGGEGLRRPGKREGGGDEPFGVEVIAADDLDGVVKVFPPIGGRSLDANLVLLDNGQVDGRELARSSQHHHRATFDGHLDRLSEGAIVCHAVEDHVRAFPEL